MLVARFLCSEATQNMHELVCDIEPQGVMKLHSMWAIMSLRAYKIDSNV